MRGTRILRLKGFVCAAIGLGSLALAAAQTANAPANSSVGDQPTCKYGYYGYAPYACAPHGFYGPEYFFKGIFVGVGPWADWGYTHGWGDHRFNRGGARAAASPAPASAPAAAAANPVAVVKHEAPIAAAPAVSHVPASGVAVAHSGGAAAHSSATVAHAGHGNVASRPSGVAGHASGVAHPSAVHGGGKASKPGSYHVPAPSSPGLYHPPPP